MSYAGISDRWRLAAVVLAVIGAVATVAGIVWAIVWLINHLRIV